MFHAVLGRPDLEHQGKDTEIDGSGSRRMTQGSLTDAMSPVRLTWLNSVAASPIFSTRARVHLLRWGGVDVRTAGVFPHVTFVSGHDVTMHDGVFVNVGVLFDARAHIEPRT